jgi:hypothetical protein
MLYSFQMIDELWVVLQEARSKKQEARSKKKATRNSPKFKAKRSGQAKRDTPALGKEKEMAQAANERKSSPRSTILTVDHLRWSGSL